jgi:negative regulator of flagellin synthesis FlgM
MRIEAYTQVQQLYKAQKSSRSTATGAAGAVKDKVQISSMGKDFQTAKAALAETPDVREELTSSLKESVQNNTYSVDDGSFAAKLLEKYNALV